MKNRNERQLESGIHVHSLVLVAFFVLSDSYAGDVDVRVSQIVAKINECPVPTWFSVNAYSGSELVQKYVLKQNGSSCAVVVSRAESDTTEFSETAWVRNQRYWFVARRLPGKEKWLMSDFGAINIEASGAGATNPVDQNWDKYRNLLHFRHRAFAELVVDLLSCDRIKKSIEVDSEDTVVINLVSGNPMDVISHTGYPLRFDNLKLVLDPKDSFKLRSWQLVNNNEGISIRGDFSEYSDAGAKHMLPMVKHSAGDDTRLDCIFQSFDKVGEENFLLAAFGLSEPPGPPSFWSSPVVWIFSFGLLLILSAGGIRWFNSRQKAGA